MAALWQAHYFVLVLFISMHAVSSQNIRLVGGGCASEGRVEVYYSSSWGTVCDDGWDMNDARVVCRQLGYASALSANSSASFGQGSDPIWLDDVDCSGYESSLFSCSHYGIGRHNCSHSNDAGVVCSCLVDPGAPSSVSVGSVMSRSFQVFWSTCSGRSNYYIDYRKSNSLYWNQLEVGSTTSRTLSNLSSSTTYDVRVQCARTRDSLARGYSSTVSATTTRDNAPSTPSVTVTTTSVSASVRWSCSGASKYFITYVKRYSGDPLSKMEVQTSNYNATVRYLMPETAYTFQVICESMYGQRSISRNVSNFTDSLVPTMFQVTPITHDAVQASWMPPTRQEAVASYKIMAFSATRQSRPLTFSASASYPFQTTLRNLAPETVYSFQIQTVSSSEGKSAWSEPVIGTTLPIVPQEVLNVTEGETTDSTITITWERTPMTVEFYQLTIQGLGVINGFTTAAYESSANVTSTTETHTFRGLQPGTAYVISITAVNKGGAGPAYTLSISTESAPVLSGLSHQQSLPIISVLGVLLIFAASCLLCILALFCYQRRKPKHLGTRTTTTVNFSVKDDGVDMHMEDNMAYAGIEYRAAENDYHEDYPSIKDDIVLLSVPPRTKASEVEHPVYEEPMPMASCSKNTHKDPVKSDPTQKAPVFEDFKVFKKYSGWFSPSLNVVLADKLSLSQGDFLKLGSGIFYMAHTQRMSAKYVGSSSSLPTALTDIMNELYCKDVRELSPIEFELKFNAPSANNWIIQVFPCSRKELSLEVGKKIIEKQTLRPYGLNRTLEVVSREDFDNLGAWHMEEMTAKAKSASRRNVTLTVEGK